MQNKLVSILIPCYNGEKYIDRCLVSCTNQTYKNIEIIILDDGSYDKSYEILQKWKNKDKRIKIYKQENKGLAFCRNKLIKLSTGIYYFFADIDDVVPENAIEILIDNSNNFKCDIVVGRTKLIFNKKTIKIPFIPAWRYCKKMTSGHYVKSNICPPWGNIVKKSFFESLNISFLNGRIFEDIGLMTYLFLKTANFKAIKNIVYYYFQNKNKKINPAQKQLSSFDSQCYKKINDLYMQSLQVFSYLNRDKLFITKEYKRYINGLFFQLIPSNIFLTKNYTNDHQIRYLLKYNLIKLIFDNNYNLKYSKTFWKSVTYFYIRINELGIINDVKNNLYKKSLIIGCANNHSNSSFKYKIINYNSSLILKSHQFNLYEIDYHTYQRLDFSNLKSNLFFLINDNFNSNNISNEIKKKTYLNNFIIFILINENTIIENLKNNWEFAVGFILDINSNKYNKNKINNIINYFNSLTCNKRLLGLKINKNHPLLPTIKDKVDRIYYK